MNPKTKLNKKNNNHKVTRRTSIDTWNNYDLTRG